MGIVCGYEHWRFRDIQNHGSTRYRQRVWITGASGWTIGGVMRQRTSSGYLTCCPQNVPLAGNRGTRAVLDDAPVHHPHRRVPDKYPQVQCVP